MNYLFKWNKTIKSELAACINPQLPSTFWFMISVVIGILSMHCSFYFFFLCAALYIFLFYKFFTANKQSNFIRFAFMFFLVAGYNYHAIQQSSLPFASIKQVNASGTVIDKVFLSTKQWPHRMTIAIETFELQNTTFKSRFLAYIYSRKRPACWVGDTITIGPINFSQPLEKDFFIHLQKEGISATSFCDEIMIITKTRPHFSLRNWIFWKRELLQITLRKKMSRPTFSFFSSLFMGNKQSVLAELENYKLYFKTWGISHHLARSGLHLLIFLMIINFLLNYLPINFFIKQIILLLITSIYGLFSWQSISFIRAFGIYIICVLGILIHKKLHPLNIFSIFCSIILLNNPLQLFALDFQLSFLLSFALLWISHLDYQKKLHL